MLDIIAFDADDTLWHNETIFTMTQAKFKKLLQPYLGREWSGQELLDSEVRNLRYFGYGIKGFVLSMIETAIEVTDGTIPSHEIQKIIDFGKLMADAPVQLLEHVGEVIPLLARSYTLMIITKGDLFDQEAKIAQSGLAEHFRYVEIVSNKTAEVYRSLWKKYEIDPRRLLMVGNSLRSDVLPVLEAGAQAVHIPYHVTWAHELISDEDLGDRHYYEIEHIGQLPQLIESLHGGSGAQRAQLQEKEGSS